MLGSWDSNQKINEKRIYGYIYIYIYIERERERERELVIAGVDLLWNIILFYGPLLASFSSEIIPNRRLKIYWNKMILKTLAVTQMSVDKNINAVGF